MAGTWLVNGTPQADLDRGVAALFAPDGVMSVRGGVLPAPTQPFALTADGSGAVKVGLGQAVAPVPGSTSAGGRLWSQSSAAASVDILGSMPGGTTARIDRIVADPIAGALVVLRGAPNVAPVPPPLSAGQVKLWQVAVPASATGVRQQDCTWEGDYTSVRGAAVSVANASARDAIPASQRFPGMTVLNTATGGQDVWTGSAWVVGDSGWVDFALSNSYQTVVGFQRPQYRIKGGVAHLRGMFSSKVNYTATGHVDVLVIPAEIRQAGLTGMTVMDGAAVSASFRFEYGTDHILYIRPHVSGSSYTLKAGDWISLAGLSWPVG